MIGKEKVAKTKTITNFEPNIFHQKRYRKFIGLVR
jgi:hypothetical protein